MSSLPRFNPLERERIAELTKRGGSGVVDLTEQKSWISNALAQAEGWGAVGLDAADNVRAIKRRTTIAAKELGKLVKWHRKSTAQELLFRVIDPSTVTKRTRRQKAS